MTVPASEQMGELRVDVASLLLNLQYTGSPVADPDMFYEGRSENEQDIALENADAVIAIVQKCEKSAREAEERAEAELRRRREEVESMGRWYRTKEDHW